MGSGVCGNLLCWQLRGKRQVSGEELESGSAPFLSLGLRLLCPPPFPVELLSPFVFALPRFQLCFGGPWGERRVFHPLTRRGLSPCRRRFRSVSRLPVSLLLPCFPSASFPFPTDVADLLSHAPCRQLARWAGASGAVNRAGLLCRFVRVPYFCVLIEVTHKKKKRLRKKKKKPSPLFQMITPFIPLDPETYSPMHPP